MPAGRPSGDSTLRQATQEELCDRLADGESLVAICRDPRMPSVRSVQTWMVDDEDFAAQIMRAREAGYLIRGERAVDAAKAAEDPAKGRLAFDAERWYLGKLSNAFSDNKTQRHEHKVDTPPVEDIAGKVAALLGQAAERAKP